MIAATSPQHLHRPKQPLVSEHMQGRNFARSSPPMWEIGRVTAAHRPLANPEGRDVSMVLRESQRDVYRVGHPPLPRKNDFLNWERQANIEASNMKRPRDGQWGAVASHVRRSPLTWNFHPSVPSAMAAPVNAVRRAYQPGVPGYNSSVQHQQQWHRLLEARHTDMIERNARESSVWSASGSIPNATEVTDSRMEHGFSHKRPLTTVQMNSSKKPKGLNKLDLLCSATLEIGPLHDNPMGCSCPKSKCVSDCMLSCTS